MFFHHEAGIFTIRQLKIIEEVKKQVDEKKISTYANLTEQTVEKQTKPLETLRKTFKKNFLFPSCPISCEGCRGQQLEFKLPHFTVFHHPYHFAWV